MVKIVVLSEVVDILDNLRKPINSNDRNRRIAGKLKGELFPYFGATGQVGWIDNYLIDGEFILIGEDGAPFLDPLKPKAYKINGKSWVNNHAHILRGKPGVIINDFLLHLLNSIRYDSYVNGTTRLKLTKGMLSELPIPLTPLHIQQSVVSKIEELFSELDKSIEQLKTAQQQLKLYRQAVLKWAFEGKLTNEVVKNGELPKRGLVRELRNYIKKIDAGKSFKCDERPPKNNEIGVLKVSAVTWGEFDELESKTVVDESRINENYFVNEGDFILSRANTIELVGNAVIVNKVSRKLMLSDKTLRINFTESIVPKYILYFFRSKKGRLQIEEFSTGNQASMRNIGQDRIKSICFPWVEIYEQHQIVAEIESRFSVANNLEESITTSLQQAESLRQSILKQAFEGKLI